MKHKIRQTVMVCITLRLMRSGTGTQGVSTLGTSPDHDEGILECHEDSVLPQEQGIMTLSSALQSGGTLLLDRRDDGFVRKRTTTRQSVGSTTMKLVTESTLRRYASMPRSTVRREILLKSIRKSKRTCLELLVTCNFLQ